MMPVFDKQWKQLGLSDDNLKTLQEQILNDPDCGAVIQGTGGLRKARFAMPNRGKSDGIRVLYVDFPPHETTYFIFTYPKNEKDNLTDDEKNNIRKLIKRIEETM